MAFIIKDRVKETTTTTGTGAITLGGAAATFDTFQSCLSNGDTTYYAIVHTSSGVDEWEVGLGTWNTGNTLTRTTVISGSNGTSAQNFQAGTKDIFITMPSSRTTLLDASGDLETAVTLGNHNTGGLAEGSNLYYTDARVNSHLSGGTGVTYNDGAISIGQAVATTDDVTFDDVTVSGNLTVNGTTTTVNSTTTTVDDPVFTIGGDSTPSSDDNKDRGIEFKWHNGSAAKLGFFGFDDSTGKFTFIPDASNSGEVFSGTAGTIAATTFEGNVTGNVTGNVVGNVTGNVSGTAGSATGNAATATALETARNIQLSGDVTGTVSFDGTGNVNITSTVVDDSHAHVISNVDGLQTALDAKVPTARTISVGGGLTGGGDLTANRTISHTDTSSQASVNGSGRTYIQDVTLDTYGHVTGLATATETVVNQTAAQILTAIKTVDGSGSGLNADQVDGVDASSFLRSDASDSASGSYSFTNAYNEFGNSTGSVSNDGGWNARLNVAGSSHARLDVKDVSDGIITSLYSHNGQGAGRVGTMSNHPLIIMSNSGESARFDQSGNLTLGGTVDGRDVAADGTKLDGIASGANNFSMPSALVPATIKFNNAGPKLDEERDQNMRITGHSGTDIGITGNDSSNNFRFQLYASLNNYGFLNGTWNAWDLQKTLGGNLYMNNNTGYYLNTSSTSNLNVLNVAGQTTLNSNVQISAGDTLIVGGTLSNNAYNSNASSTIYLGGGNDRVNYSIGTLVENTGGSYTKLDLRWHTGIRMFAMPQYGGLRYFTDNAMSTLIFSIGQGDSNVRVTNNLIVGGTVDGRDVAADGTKLDGFAANTSYLRSDTADTIDNSVVITQRGSFTTATSNQNNSHGGDYNYGYQQPGGWSHPYPDLVVGYHTGMRLGGYYGYGGTRFYNDHPYRTTTILFSVGNGDSHVRATNNIYAYTSDIRLKENFRPIENAVDKVKAIGGFIFDWRKDMMEKHEFTPDQQQDDAGLIAQEVQKVMPAAIKRAPFDHDLTKPNQSKSGEEFLTVQYEKMVPLLVEAIKEQQKQIDELKEKLETK